MRRIHHILNESVAWRCVAAATACVLFFGMFAAAGHAHDLHEVRDADCVGCRLLQIETSDEPGVEAPVVKFTQSPFKAEAADRLVVDQQVRLAPLRGPPTLA